MLMNIEELVRNYNMNINGVIPIGAHYGDEYERFCGVGVTDFLMFEPNPDSFNTLKGHLGDKDNVTLENVALGHIKKEGVRCMSKPQIKVCLVLL